MKIFKRILFVSGILGFLLLINYKYQLIAVNIKSCDTRQRSFRVMTYNVANGLYNEKIEPRNRKDSLLKIIQKVYPDILCLHECSRWHIRGLESLLVQEYPYIAHSQSMYSRFKVVNSFVIKPDTLSDEYKSLKHQEPAFMGSNKSSGVFYCADLLIGNHIVRVINVRLATNNISSMHESSFFKKFPAMYKNYNLGERLRKSQIEHIRNVITESPYPVILCGDINDISGSSTINLFSQNGLEDAWWHSGRGYGATYNDHGMHLRIDHVLYDKNFMPMHSQVVESAFSDHLPLIVDFNFCIDKKH